MTVRVGLIGTGEMARTHAAAWASLDADVTVHSRSKERGAEFATTHGFAVEHSRSALFGQVDVVDICTPTDTHPVLVHEAAEAGVHVICEKPIALSLETAAEMIDHCREVGVRLFVGHTLRYFPAYAIARDVIRSGGIGELRSMKLDRVGEFPPWATWFAEVERSGGVLVDLAIHDLDFARWTAGEVTSVRAEVTGAGGPPMRGEARLEHASGVISHITAVWDEPGVPFRPTFEIVGGNGSLRFDSLPTAVLLGPDGTRLWEDDGVDAYALQLQEFAAAIEGGTDLRVTTDDAVAALRIALAGVESARTGEDVRP
ncbi:MAG TPA: Gfo/Idh/MocA family oxidoreductase [Actinopolymorphaceae bacterium]